MPTRLTTTVGRLAFSGLGLMSLIWFLVRVIPKPSRAMYPCQRVAAPVASSFVIWLLAIAASARAWRRSREFSREANWWKAGSLQGGAEDYLHEAALADAPPSGTFYDPETDGARMTSLGAHEHWNNGVEKKYSRNLGLNVGIELVALQASRPVPRLDLRRSDRHAVITWPASLYDFRLQRADSLSPPVNWTPVSDLPVVTSGFNTVSNELGGQGSFYRLAK